MEVRQITQCGVLFRFGPWARADLMRQSANSEGGVTNRGISNLANITPPGTAPGTFHFRYRCGEEPARSAGFQTIVEVIIRGWQEDRRGYISGQPTFRIFNMSNSFQIVRLPESILARRSNARGLRITTGGPTTDRTAIISGIPTQFSGWYSISMRVHVIDNDDNTGNSDRWSLWQSIRFQQRGTFRPPPPPTVGIPLDIRGTDCTGGPTTTWQFLWNEPIADMALNILAAQSYDWAVTGATTRDGNTLLPRLAVPALNAGQHTLTLRGVNQDIRSLPVTYPFFVRDSTPCCAVHPPSGGRQIPSGATGVTLAQFDAPEIGQRPTLYPWTLTATGPPPGGTATPTVPSGKGAGVASPTVAGGTVRITGLPEGRYNLNVKSSGCVPPATSALGFNIPLLVRDTPEQPFPPRNLRVTEGATRTTAESTWQPPRSLPKPDGYEYKIDGATTHAMLATPALAATHSNLNPGRHKLSVRSTKVGSPPSAWATRDFIVRGEGCNPVVSLEEGQGTVWSSRNLFWAAPVGGMPVTGHIWELTDTGGASVQNGTTGATERRVSLFKPRGGHLYLYGARQLR